MLIPVPDSHYVFVFVSVSVPVPIIIIIIITHTNTQEAKHKTPNPQSKTSPDPSSNTDKPTLPNHARPQPAAAACTQGETRVPITQLASLDSIFFQHF